MYDFNFEFYAGIYEVIFVIGYETILLVSGKCHRIFKLAKTTIWYQI